MSRITIYPCEPINIDYVGSFRLQNQANLNYSWGICSYDNTTEKIVVSGNYTTPNIGVYTKPTVGSILVNQQWYDPTMGNWAYITAQGTNGARHRGFIADNNQLWMHTTPYYVVTGSSNYCASMGYFDGSAFHGWAKSSIHQLQSTGPMCAVPQNVQSLFGADTASFNQDQQGGNLTNWGPALYVYSRQNSNQWTLNTPQPVTTLFSRIGSSNAWENWWPDRKLTSLVITQKYVVISYSKTFGARWYGNYGHGKNGYGRLWDESATVPEHDIGSELYPGQIATDGTANQGFHSEKTNCFLLIATIQDCLSDEPVWQEADLSTLGINAPLGEFRICYNETDDLIYGFERNGDNNLNPLGHILKIA